MLALLLTLAIMLQERPVELRPWDQVKAVEPGTELRIFKRNVKLPLLAKMDEATEDHLIVLVADAQVAIRRAEIDRIDRRPHSDTGRVTRQPRKYNAGVHPTLQGQPMRLGSGSATAVANAARTDTLTIRSKAPFEFLYRRTSNPN